MNPSLSQGDNGPEARTSRVKAVSALGPALILVLLTLVAYWPIRHNGFVLFDDPDYITRNEIVQRGLTAGGVALAFTKCYAGNWLPLTWISHMTDVELFGLDPRGHHLAGLGIHLATAVLLLLTLRGMTGRAGPSFLVAALFAVHPLHVESVAWASERKDVLSAFFWMLTTALYLRHARRPGFGRYLAVLVCFALGLMAKQMLVTLPLVLLLLDYWPLGRYGSGAGTENKWSRLPVLGLEKAPLLALAGLAGLVTLKAQATIGLVHSLNTFPLAARVGNAILSPVRYLVKTVWPADLSIFYPYPFLPLSDPRILAAGGFLVAASAAVILLQRRRPWLFAGWLWYLLTLLPVIGLIQVGDQSMADRYTYIPLVGIFIACSWSLAAAGNVPAGSRGALAAGAVVALVLLTGLTRGQVAVWRDDETLFGHAIRVNQDNWLAVYLLGLSRDQNGDADAAARFYRESIRIKPDYENSRVHLVRLLHRQGRTAEALGELRSAVEAMPGSQRFRITLARALREQGSAAEAIAVLRDAVNALPEDHELRMSLALTLAESGLEEEAIAQYREMIRRWPNFPDPYNNLAALLVRQGQVDEARALLRRALEIDPSYPDARLNLEALSGDLR